MANSGRVVLIAGMAGAAGSERWRQIMCRRAVGRASLEIRRGSAVVPTGDAIHFREELSENGGPGGSPIPAKSIST